MKNVLIVAYYFPPSGGPGVQRVLKMVKYLPAFGWNPIVLTVQNGTFPARDESLLQTLPPELVVHRTHIYEPYDLYKMFVGEKQNTAIDVSVLTAKQTGGWKKRIANFIRSTFFIPDARIGWLFSAVREGRKMIDMHNIDAIYSSSPPYTCSLIGRALHRQTRLPWVAGLRDPWTEFLTTPHRWWLPARIDKALEHSVLKEADVVECAWKGIISDALRKYPHLDAQKFLHVPNGFDSDEFPDVPQEPSERFTITYSGSLYGLRNPDTLLAALNMLVQSGDIRPDEVLLRCVGRVGDDVKAKFEADNLRHSIEIIPYVPHKESVAYLLKSDALLLIVDDAKESNEIVPGKVYEYIGVGKPVIALAPAKSAIAELLEETRAGDVIAYGDVEACAKSLRTMIQRYRKGESLYSPNTTAIKSYERREAARTLASTLDQLCAKK